MSETPTTTTSQKSIAIHLPFVSQYASICIAVLSVPLCSEEREVLSVLLPFVSQYVSHLYCNTPPIRIAVLLGKSWWLWSPGCSQKGPGEKGAPRNHPESSSQKLADFECRFPKMNPMEGTEHHFGPFQEKDFGEISGGPLFSRPLCFTADSSLPP